MNKPIAIGFIIGVLCILAGFTIAIVWGMWKFLALGIITFFASLAIAAACEGSKG